MKQVSILDCTLRDGGYINDWNFGKEAIRQIITKLGSAGVDCIECGFLRDVSYRKDASVFSDVSQIAPLIAPKKKNTLYVAMIALGEIDVQKILPCDETSIDGIRLTFHKQDWEKAKQAALHLMDKGYKVFIQPVGTTSYSDEELLRLIVDVNALRPFAFYLVDTLGILYRHDLLRLFYLIEHNLDSQITIGFHSHNNLQLSFANAQELLRLNTKHDMIIDTSVYGMGRGVGNLSTELLAEYINANIEQRYLLDPLLTIADQYLMSIFAEQSWGYALPYFLSAREQCHPNYASYLLKKETLTIEGIFKILSIIPAKQRDLYSPKLIEKLYLSFQNCQFDDTETIAEMQKIVQGKTVLILAPGASITAYEQQILHFSKNPETVTIAVNFCPQSFETDLIFISNKKRLDLLKKEWNGSTGFVATSNLLNDEMPDTVRFVNYSSYLGEGKGADNVGAMLIRVLKRAGVGRIALAGFDGFDVDSSENYCVNSYKRAMDRKTTEEKNEDISKQLKQALKGISYDLLTPTRYKI